ncbi:hypothetical protein RKD48_002362 [Streptomyces ambofaciens]
MFTVPESESEVRRNEKTSLAPLFWDVAHGRSRLEPGPYALLVGASSEDVRLSTTVVLDGEPAAPRPGGRRGLAAADFDEQSGTEIVDRTKTVGDAVTAVTGRTGELLYRDCDFGTGVSGVTVSVAGTGSVEVALDGGPAVAVLAPDAPTAGPYAYVDLESAFTAQGIHDLRVRLRGALRLAHVGFSG